MPLLKDNVLVEDSWVVVADGDDLPAEGGAIVTLARWEAERETLKGRNAPLGITLSGADSLTKIADDLASFQVIRLLYPAFTDGRAYSSARLLRDRYGFTGEVRAAGNVLRDQYAHMLRSGFDAFEVKDGIDPEAWRESRDVVGLAYQNATDGVRAIWAKRHGRAA